MPKQPSRKYILYILAVMNFTHIIDSMLIMPLGDTFISEFNISPSQYSWLVSAYALAASISCVLGILFLDRLPRKNALLFLYGGFAIGTFLCSLCTTYETLITLRAATGFFGGMIGALVLSIISDLFPFKERGAAMGILFASFSAASALGVPFGIYLAAKGSWQMPFMILGLLGVVIAGIIFFTFPAMNDHFKLQPKKRKSLFQILGTVLGDKNQVYALTAGFVLIMGHFMIIPFISPFMIKNIGLTQIEVAYQFFAGGVATFITSPIIGKMTDKYGVMRVFMTVMLISWIPTLIITNLTTAPLSIAISLVAFFFIFGSGRMISPNTIITAAASTETRGSFMSLKSALQQLAIAATAFISGTIVTIGADGKYQNYNYTGYLAIFFCIITIYLVSKIKVAKGN